MKKLTSCADCIYARQVGDKSIQHIVGCALLTKEELRPSQVTGGEIYKGYMYSSREVGFVAESKVLGTGVLTYGWLTDATSGCPQGRTK